MADVASRPAMFAPTKPHLSNEDFRSSFDIAFPLPNEQEWKLSTVPDWLKSVNALMSTINPYDSPMAIQ